MVNPIDVVRDIYAARSAGDRSRMFASIHASVIFTTNARPDKAGDGATVVGLAASLAHLQSVAEHWSEERFEPGRLRIDGDTVTCRVAIALRHRRTGTLLDGHKRQIWTIRTGQVRSMAEIFDAELVNAIHRLETPNDTVMERRGPVETPR